MALDDLSFVETHDCFTIAELIEYEAMGLAPRGEGGRIALEGQTAKGGRLPVNPSGGLKSKGHPIGATGVSMHALTAMQLTGEAGGIQVPGRRARRHLQHGRRGGRQLRLDPGTHQVKHSAIVTGGASGIGLAVAERLLDDGWPVAVLDADRGALAAAETAFADENAIFLGADVTDEDEIADAFDQVVDRLGLVGGLVNSAGLLKSLPAEDTRPSCCARCSTSIWSARSSPPRRRSSGWAHRCRSSTSPRSPACAPIAAGSPMARRRPASS